MIWSHVFFRYELCFIALIVFIFSLWLTLYLRFIQIRYFSHAWSLLNSKIKKSFDLGEISQAQALTLGLSGTIGIANIAVVSACIVIAGPGSIFWLIVSAIVGMTIKFCEATLGQKFRIEKNNHIFIGGPMVTLDRSLDEGQFKNPFISKKIKKVGVDIISIAYTLSLLIIILIFGNLFQMNQLGDIFKDEYTLSLIQINHLPYMVIFLIMTLVWNGKFNRLAYFVARVIPVAISIYIIFCLSIILVNLDRFLDLIVVIFKDAFTIRANGYDNLFVFVIGILLGMVSHESGLGISSIAHASARVRYPVHQGFIAMLEPFIDTILICFCTAFVLLIAMEQGFQPTGFSSLNVKLAFEFFIPWFGLPFNLIMTLLTLSCLVSSYFYVGKLIQYLLSINLSLYTLLIYSVLIYVGAFVQIIDLIPIILYVLPFVILPNLACIAMNIKDLRKDIIVYLTNLDDSFVD